MNISLLDARHLLCPLPVIRVQEKVKVLDPGDIVEVLGTDPGIMEDIPAWCRINGHKILESRHQEDEYLILLEVGHTPQN